MAPPPVPPSRKISIVAPTKKRARDVDDILGDEVDAMTSQAQPAPRPPAKSQDEAPTKKARRSPEKQLAPKKRERELEAYLEAPTLPPPSAPPPGPVPVSAVGVTVPTTNPFASEELPSLSGASVPFRHKRAKQLVTTLQKDPSAVLVSPITHLIPVLELSRDSSSDPSTPSRMAVRREPPKALLTVS